VWFLIFDWHQAFDLMQPVSHSKHGWTAVG